MKINDGFILRELAGQYILVPFGDTAINLHGVVTLNTTAKFLWENCGDGEIDVANLQNALISEYEIGVDTAKEAVDTFINQLRDAGCIDE